MSDSFQPQTIDLSASFVQLIRTALNNPKITLDKTGLKSYDANGNLVVAINADGTAQFSGVINALGVALPSSTASDQSLGAQNVVEWTRQPDGAVLARVGAANPANTESTLWEAWAYNPDNDTKPVTAEIGASANSQTSPRATYSQIECEATGGGVGQVVALASDTTNGASDALIYNSNGSSAFLQTVNALGEIVASRTTARNNLGFGTAPSGAYLSASRVISGTGAQLMKADTKEPAPMDQTNLITSAGWVQYRCPATGLYLFMLRSTIETSAASNSIVADIYKNGAKLLTMDQVPSNGAANNFYGLAGSYFVPCNAGDTLEAGFEVFAISSTTLYGGYTYTGWQVVRWS